MNTAQYIKIFDDALLRTLSNYGLPILSIIFQQENNPKHKLKTAAAFCTDCNIKKLPWAASSSDMNIIENTWTYLNRKVHDHYPLPTN
ncbi:hypothetical protein NUW54_g10 [Trametes sanguinea]|uniref:Uncharacterized protein n=2 Tax=Trametes sanguinea TaxID=158606 RepID=A0ACC1QAJ9_9APHY|nr:hypothetical protein NUW54_g23 [Trametes sanguinea]KAJ3019701.1 hypothetical protein NUW54_g10 [Trametes sanguinea]